MALIEIPLNSFRYHFRPLTWGEEARLIFPKGEDQRKVILATAMVDVSGMKVTPPQALKVLKQIPEALIWRIWIAYRGSLPEDRYYSSGGIYEAPDPMKYRAQIENDEQGAGALADAATSKLEQKFGRAEAEEAEDISRLMFHNARSSGTLVPVTEGAPHG